MNELPKPTNTRPQETIKRPKGNPPIPHGTGTSGTRRAPTDLLKRPQIFEQSVESAVNSKTLSQRRNQKTGRTWMRSNDDLGPGREAFGDVLIEKARQGGGGSDGFFDGYACNLLLLINGCDWLKWLWSVNLLPQDTNYIASDRS